MTIPVAADSTTLLTRRLADLRADRTELVAATRLAGNGDIADRATNVEASIRLQLLDERIASLELEIADASQRQHVEGVVSVGDVVTLDLGDGDETYLIGSVEQAAAGVDTITPGSPLGQAIVGAEVGSTLTYSPRAGTTLSVRIRAAGERLRPTA
jgi:transcription elongation factor GreA